MSLGICFYEGSRGFRKCDLCDVTKGSAGWPREVFCSSSETTSWLLLLDVFLSTKHFLHQEANTQMFSSEAVNIKLNE